MAGPPEIEWLEPWYAEDDRERSSHFEAELQRELRCDHVLFAVPVELIGSRRDRDDFLFRLLDVSGRVAVVHLTFRGRTEVTGFPATSIYASLQEWVEEAMRPDHEEWAE